MTTHEILALVRELKAAHPARAHATGLIRTLQLPGYEGQAELLRPAAWHFAAWTLAQDPEGLSLERSGHNDGMHSDLVVRSAEWGRVAAFTWTSGTRTLTDAANADYVEEFLLRRRAEERRLAACFSSGRPDPGHPSVAAALVVRAATDPTLGWEADVDGGEHGDPGGPWYLGPAGGAPVVVVDLQHGTITGLASGEAVLATDLAGALADPLEGIERLHHSLAAISTKRTLASLSGRSLRILHADWGIKDSKRVVAAASRDSTGWLLEEVGPWSEVHRAEVLSGDGPVLAGFDFPIGLPRAFARAASVSSFPDLLPRLGRAGDWCSFYEVCEEPDQISFQRPFYPRSATRGSNRRRADLEAALELSYAELLRACERRTPVRGEASALFWLVGAKQVGRGAIAGWREVIAPAVERGAFLWPFDGGLSELLDRGGVTIAETYPAEFYGHFDFPTSGWSKTDQAGRARVGALALKWAEQNQVTIASEVLRRVEDGFGSRSDGEDSFDAVVGALGMIRVLSAGMGAHPPDEDICRFEGWILGQTPDLAVSASA